MRRRTFLASSAAALGGTGLLVGTQGFSTTEAERGISIDVVGDGDAFLRLEYPPQSIACAGEIHLVKIRNLTGSALTSVTVSVKSIPDTLNLYRSDNAIMEGDEIVVVDEAVGESLDIGEEQSVQVTATADEGFTGAGEVAFHVSASGPGISIDTTAPRTVTVSCDCSGTDDD